MKEKIKVLIVDDHAVVRAGITTILGLAPDLTVVGEAGNGKIALRKSRELHPDVVIMDLMMPVLDGVAATKALSAEMPETKVLILTTDGSSLDIARALEAGALGVIIKTAPNTSLVSAIRAVAAGKQAIAPEVKKLLESQSDVSPLTNRQKEILGCVTQGLANKQIAEQYGISLDGVKGHIRKIFAKIGATNRAEAIAIALRKHLLKM